MYKCIAHVNIDMQIIRPKHLAAGLGFTSQLSTASGCLIKNPPKIGAGRCVNFYLPSIKYKRISAWPFGGKTKHPGKNNEQMADGRIRSKVAVEQIYSRVQQGSCCSPVEDTPAHKQTAHCPNGASHRGS